MDPSHSQTRLFRTGCRTSCLRTLDRLHTERKHRRRADYTEVEDFFHNERNKSRSRAVGMACVAVPSRSRAALHRRRAVRNRKRRALNRTRRVRNRTRRELDRRRRVPTRTRSALGRRRRVWNRRRRVPTLSAPVPQGGHCPGTRGAWPDPPCPAPTRRAGQSAQPLAGFFGGVNTFFLRSARTLRWSAWLSSQNVTMASAITCVSA